jgi:hypothetical protein
MITITFTSGEGPRTFSKDVVQLPKSSARSIAWGSGLARFFNDQFTLLGITDDAEKRLVVAEVNRRACDKIDHGAYTIAELVRQLAPKSKLNEGRLLELNTATSLFAEGAKRARLDGVARLLSPLEGEEVRESTPPVTSIGLSLDAEYWEYIITLALMSPVTVDGHVFIENLQIAGVSKFFYDVVRRIKNRFANLYTGAPEFFSIGEAMQKNKMTVEEYKWIKNTGLTLIDQHSPNDYIYIFPGASLAPVAVYLKQVVPSAHIVFLPVSGLAGDLDKALPKFDTKLTSVFYHYYLSGVLDLIMNQQKGVVVADYSSSGQTVMTIWGHLKEYFRSLGVTESGLTRLIRTFEVTNKRNIAAPRLTEIEWDKFLRALKNEHIKGKELLVFDKPSRYVFDPSLEKRQRVKPLSFMKMWLTIESYRQREGKL